MKNLRYTNILNQTMFQTIIYGKTTFKYYGTHKKFQINFSEF